MTTALRLLVSSIPSSSCDVAAVTESDTLTSALTKMQLENYSQLAVCDGEGHFIGVVTWKSVAIALSRNSLNVVGNAVQAAESVSIDADLLPLVTRIYDNDFVIVTDNENRPVGIVTTADLTLEFASHAEIYLLLRELETLLCACAVAAFSLEEVHSAFKKAEQKLTLSSFEEATLHQYQRILGLPALWDQLGWPLDREQVVSAVAAARDVRNAAMHFDDQHLTDHDTAAVRNLVTTLRRYAPRDTDGVAVVEAQ